MRKPSHPLYISFITHMDRLTRRRRPSFVFYRFYQAHLRQSSPLSRYKFSQVCLFILPVPYYVFSSWAFLLLFGLHIPTLSIDEIISRSRDALLSAREERRRRESLRVSRIETARRGSRKLRRKLERKERSKRSFERSNILKSWSWRMLFGIWKGSKWPSLLKLLAQSGLVPVNFSLLSFSHDRAAPPIAARLRIFLALRPSAHCPQRTPLPGPRCSSLYTRSTGHRRRSPLLLVGRILPYKRSDDGTLLPNFGLGSTK
jgi:hypothetical protein